MILLIEGFAFTVSHWFVMAVPVDRPVFHHFEEPGADIRPEFSFTDQSEGSKKDIVYNFLSVRLRKPYPHTHCSEPPSILPEKRPRGLCISITYPLNDGRVRHRASHFRLHHSDPPKSKEFLKERDCERSLASLIDGLVSPSSILFLFT